MWPPVLAAPLPAPTSPAKSSATTHASQYPVLFAAAQQSIPRLSRIWTGLESTAANQTLKMQMMQGLVICGKGSIFTHGRPGSRLHDEGEVKKRSPGAGSPHDIAQRGHGLLQDGRLAQRRLPRVLNAGALRPAADGGVDVHRCERSQPAVTRAVLQQAAPKDARRIPELSSICSIACAADNTQKVWGMPCEAAAYFATHLSAVNRKNNAWKSHLLRQASLCRAHSRPED